MDEIKFLENSKDMMKDNLEIVASLRNSSLTNRLWVVAIVGFMFLIILINSKALSDEIISGISLIVIAIPWVCFALTGAAIRLLQGALNVLYSFYNTGQMVRIRSIVDVSRDYVTDEQILNQINELDDKIQTQRSEVERFQLLFTWLERLMIIFLCAAFLGSVIYTIIVYI